MRKEVSGLTVSRRQRCAGCVSVLLSLRPGGIGFGHARGCIEGALLHGTLLADALMQAIGQLASGLSVALGGVLGLLECRHQPGNLCMRGFGLPVLPGDAPEKQRDDDQ